MDTQTLFVGAAGFVAGFLPPICGFGGAIVFNLLWFIGTEANFMDQTEDLKDSIMFVSLCLSVSFAFSFFMKFKEANIPFTLYMGAIQGGFSLLGLHIVNTYGKNIWFKRSMGYVFLLVLLMQVLSKQKKKLEEFAFTPYNIALVGIICVISGIGGGIAGIGGPPFILLVLLFNYNKKTFLPSYVGSAAIRCATILPYMVFASDRNFNSDLVNSYASVMIGSIVGTSCGLLISPKVNQKNFRVALQVVLFVGSIGLGLKGFEFQGYVLCIVLGTMFVVSIYSCFGSYSINKALAQEAKILPNSKRPVFFLIGSQRSGSNWLRSMMNESPDVAGPHPPHILKRFNPEVMEKFGDLENEENFKTLIDHVCEFVEKNPVSWEDNEGKKIYFDRENIFLRARGHVFVSSSRKNSLVSVFASVMDVFAQCNSKETWICKSMGYGKFHDELLDLFSHKLRYIYLHRDPRDVCLSFKKAVVGDSHFYVIAQTWKKLQEIALGLLDKYPQLFYRISYENLLDDKESEMARVLEFMGSHITENVLKANKGREAQQGAAKSSLWANLIRGESIRDQQIQKWRKGMNEQEVKFVESVCEDIMNRLGYQVEFECELPTFTPEQIAEFEELNETGKKEKKNKLHEENPSDEKRRLTQLAVLQKSVIRVAEQTAL